MPSSDSQGGRFIGLRPPKAFTIQKPQVGIKRESFGFQIRLKNYFLALFGLDRSTGREKRSNGSLTLEFLYLLDHNRSTIFCNRRTGLGNRSTVSVLECFQFSIRSTGSPNRSTIFCSATFCFLFKLKNSQQAPSLSLILLILHTFRPSFRFSTF